MLRVINEDIIAPGRGFSAHPHRDMEIITYVVNGALAHRDSTGRESVIRPGMVQHMTAGRGIRHSEHNASATEPVHLLQIWLVPDAPGYEPSYGEHTFGKPRAGDGLRLLVAPGGDDGRQGIRQNARMYDARLAAGERINLRLEAGRSGWLQLISGRLEFAGIALSSGDGLGIKDITDQHFTAREDSLLLLFDLP